MEDVLGLLALAGYIVAVVGLASGVTWAVIKIFPTERNPKKSSQPDEPSTNGGGEKSAGSLFRRSKRSR